MKIDTPKGQEERDLPKEILEDSEMLNFIEELIDVAVKTRQGAKSLLEKWDLVKKAKEENPYHWFINK